MALPNSGGKTERVLAEALWPKQIEMLLETWRNYRWRLLAAACLARAKGPGGDAVELAAFCRRWKLPTMIALKLLVKVAKRPLDLTSALSSGAKIMAVLVPVLGAIQMRGAQLAALDSSFVAPEDTTGVLQVLQTCGQPAAVCQQLANTKKQLETMWDDTVALWKRLERLEANVR